MSTNKIILFTAIIYALPLGSAQAFSATENHVPDIELSVDNQTFTPNRNTVLSLFNVFPRLIRTQSETAEIENIDTCPSDITSCKLERTAHTERFITKISSTSINEESFRSLLKEIKSKLDKPAENPKFQINADGRVEIFSPASSGVSLNIDRSLENIKRDFSSLQNNSLLKTALALDTLAPTIRTGDINDLGISELIGEATTNFRGSPRNRVFNINVAAKKFQGVLIKPGEEFSFVSTLGPVDGENGYLPELVIKKNKTEPEFGGGICQVSTTMFRAAINSGLDITARRNHAYPVSYYNPIGMDATVYVPRPDLKFINNTPGHILIQMKIAGTELTYQFYGTKDGRSVTIDGPTILEKNPDGSMKAVFSQTVRDRNGNIIVNDTFPSSYESPSKFPHPGEKLTEKPTGWSDREWRKYKKENNV